MSFARKLILAIALSVAVMGGGILAGTEVYPALADWGDDGGGDGGC